MNILHWKIFSLRVWHSEFKRLSILIIAGIFISAFAGSQGIIHGTTSGNTGFSIKYIGEVSGNNKKKVNFINRIGNLIAGSSPVLISKPVNMVAAAADNIWILSQGNGTIIRDEKGEITVPLTIRRNKMEYPSLVGITKMEDNSILFTDSKLNRIFMLSPDKKEVMDFKDSLVQPTGIAFSHINDEIWVVETGAHRISVLDRNGRLLKRIGNRGTGKGEFNYPTNIWIDRDGFAYVVDAMNFRIEIFSSDGTCVSTFGKSGDATGYFARPKGVATDTYGNIYVTDALFNSVQVFDREGRLLYYFGSQGNGKEQFWMPSGIYIDNNNIIYIADSYNARIQVFQLIKGEVNE